MLTMDDVKYIKRLHNCEGVSIREIMRRTGYHYETVKKYLERDDFNPPPKKSNESHSLLDPLKPIIDDWLMEDMKAPKKQRHSSKRIYERLQKEYPKYLKVKERTVQYYVSKKKKELWQFKQEAYLPLYHPPGEAQVDFGHFSYKDNAGEMINALKLTMSFPYSNQGYCQIFGGENQECLLQGMKNVFEYIGCVPGRIVFDNLSAAVSYVGKGQKRTLTEGFNRFMLHYGFEASFCNGAAGWEKGNVENKVGYERRNMFVPVPTIFNIKEFNEQLFATCDRDAKRPHYVKKTLISTLFLEDKEHMKELNAIPYEVFRLEPRTADKYGKVSFESNLYSSSPKYAKETVYVKATSFDVTLLNKDYKVIENHQRLYGKGLESMKWLPYIELLAKRPTAIKYTEFYNNLPDNWRKYLASQDREGKRKGLNSLYSLLQRNDMRSAENALEFALNSGVNDAGSIIAAHRTLTSKVQHMDPMQLNQNVLTMPLFEPNNNKYDEFFKQEVSS